MGFGNIFRGEVADGLSGLLGRVGFDKDKVILGVEFAEALKGFVGVGLAGADGVGGANDATGFTLAKDGVEARHVRGGCRDEITKDIAGADGGELVGVAYEQEVSGRGDRLKEVSGEAGIEHTRFVDD